MSHSFPDVNRLHQLDKSIDALGWLWRHQPFKEIRPAWCAEHPKLTEALLQLSDVALLDLSNDNPKLIAWLAGYLPELTALHRLCELPFHSTSQTKNLGPHFNTAIPGRKLSQINAFTAAVGKIDHPIIEWCGGKGHLGRQLAANWQQPVITLEHNGELCHAGNTLAKKAHIEQKFHVVDVLAADSGRYLAQHHAVALHACGDLHRTLIRQAVAKMAPAIDVAPCCYHLGQHDHYHPFNKELKLKLNRDELRLAITETVTAAPREIKWRDQEMAWKLGYDQLRRSITDRDHYQPMKPINKQWLRESFEKFCTNLATRDNLELQNTVDWSHFEALGWQRQREVMRLSLVRNAFRRPLEIWLVLDIGTYLTNHGYHVEIGQFCAREITPRNILISAQRTDLQEIIEK